VVLSIVPLGLYTATATSRLHFLGVRAAGASIALFGGLAATTFLALSALAQWALAFPDVLVSAPAVRALHLLAFATGGPAHVMPLGLLVAGLAVTAGLHHLVPRSLMTTGLYAGSSLLGQRSRRGTRQTSHRIASIQRVLPAPVRRQTANTTKPPIPRAATLGTGGPF
jgi:hypothetical protein